MPVGNFECLRKWWCENVMCLRHICRADLFRRQILLMARCKTANIATKIFGIEWVGVAREGSRKETERHERWCEGEGNRNMCAELMSGRWCLSRLSQMDMVVEECGQWYHVSRQKGSGRGAPCFCPSLHLGLGNSGREGQ